MRTNVYKNTQRYQMEELVVESPDITLTSPVYSVTRIKLVSARIPNSQLLINDFNNEVDGHRVANGNYATGHDLASALNAATSGSLSFDDVTQSIDFTSTGPLTMSPWLAGIVGYPSGRVDLSGTRYITLRLTVGQDVLAQKVISENADCHYLGKVLTGPLGQVINYTDKFDTVEMETQIKSIQSLHVDFLNPDGSHYDFGGQPWILKFHLSCSTDKMSVTSREVAPPSLAPASVPWIAEPDNQRFIMIAVLVVLTIGLMLLLG